MNIKKQFIESQIQFSFYDSWDVVAFDKTKFYKTISGLGVKGVDFLGIHNQQLYFIEVKNFNQYSSIIEKEFDFKAFRNNIIIKFEDSQRAIRLIHEHYARKWWYSSSQYLPKRILSLFAKDFLFWEQCYKILNNSTQNSRFILWIEHNFDTKTFSQQIVTPISLYFENSFSTMNHAKNKKLDFGIKSLLLNKSRKAL